VSAGTAYLSVRPLNFATEVSTNLMSGANNIWLSGAGSGAYQFTGSNTFNDFKIDNLPKNIQFTAGTTTTVATVTCPTYNPAAVKFVQLIPQSATSNITTPDSVATSVTGEIDLICLRMLNSWNNGVYLQSLFGKWKNAGQLSYTLGTANTSKLQFAYTQDGTNVITANSSTAYTRTEGAWYWSRAHFKPAGTVDFFTAPYAGSNTPPTAGQWTQLGTTVSITAGSIFDGTDLLTVGDNGLLGIVSNTVVAAGRVQVWSGDSTSGGVLKADFNADDWVTGNTMTSSTTGEVWTRNGNALFSPEVKISSITSATHTLTKTGGGKVYLGDHVNVTYSIASPVTTWYAGSTLSGATNGGNNTNWVFGANMLAGAGAFTLTGNDANLIRGLVMQAGAGAFTLTGNDAALRKDSILRAATGSFALTGNEARMMQDWKIVWFAGHDASVNTITTDDGAVTTITVTERQP
jgi:hypothetical protein